MSLDPRITMPGGLIRSSVPTIPVIGPRNVEQVERSFNSLSLDLAEEDLARLSSQVSW